MNSAELIITPRRPALLSGLDNTLDLLVRVQAPDSPKEGLSDRSKLNLALVIDRSGSMAGEPLAEAKRCAAFVIDRLKTTDSAALVAYDNRVKLIKSATRMSDKQDFHRAIATIDEGGNTNLHGGWLKGAEAIAKFVDPSAVTRVILLSDGQANEGLTDENKIFLQCAELAKAGVTTSTYGLGGGFNESLMIGMAKHGMGNSYYGSTVEDLMDPFQEEFSLLEALYAGTVRMTITVPTGVKLQLMNRYAHDGDTYRLPDLAYDGESWALIRLTIPKGMVGEGNGEFVEGLLEVCVTFSTRDGQTQTINKNCEQLVSLPTSAWHAVAEDELVMRRAIELKAADIQDQAQEAARNGDWTRVKKLLKDIKESAGDDKWLNDVVVNLENLASEEDEVMLRKEMSYQANYMRSRSACKQESMPCPIGSEPMFLRKKTARGKKQ